ncbi:MAG TPA: putative glycoside hydrolase [Symbiobacteriaceae bacterium]|nr:putative glycoside hydrolase [Symbiobacteriaceae bacterium]
MKRRWATALLTCSLALGGCAVAPVASPNLTAPGPVVAVKAEPALEQTSQPSHPALPAQATKAPARTHVDVHGLYMTGWTAGSERFYELVDYMVQTGLNAAVIDVQDDDGYISWETEIPLALEIGAHEAKIPDIEARIRHLKENGLYTIARIVVYADPLLGRTRPDMAILGGDFVDSRGIRWPDPYNREVWAYKVAVAKEAARVGFDEIQFDYIRFPEHHIEGYNYLVPIAQRTAAVEGFLSYASEELKPLGVFIAADVFGLTTSVAEGDDMEIGQDYAGIAGIVDYILPMVYPSHYAPGTYGVDDPNAEPGRIVYESMVAAQQRTWGMDLRKHRPWIQDFDYGKAYSAADIEEQIRGLAAAGIYQWILWDPNNTYTPADYGVAGKSGPPGAWRAQFEAEQQHGLQRALFAEAMQGRFVE